MRTPAYRLWAIVATGLYFIDLFIPSVLPGLKHYPALSVSIELLVPFAICWLIAKANARSGWWALIGVANVLGVIALLVLFRLERRAAPQSAAGPVPATGSDQPTAAAPAPAGSRHCAACGALNHAWDIDCRYCGSAL